MSTQDSFRAAVAAGSDAPALARYVLDAVAGLAAGGEPAIDFLGADAVGAFCAALGIEGNWATRSLDEIAPPDASGINAVSAADARRVLDLFATLVAEGSLRPTDAGVEVPEVLADFTGGGAHPEEFAYALAVELEHGTDRGQNITMNHPLLTGMVVLAHLAEDPLYYARLRVMEAEGELFEAELSGAASPELDAHRATLADARRRLEERLDEKRSRH